MACDRRAFGISVPKAPYTPLGCCPDDTPSPGPGPGPQPTPDPDDNPGTISPGGDGTITEGESVPQPNPQPDPPVRQRRRSVLNRRPTSAVPTPQNNWRWRNRASGVTPPTGGGGPPGVEWNPGGGGQVPGRPGIPGDADW